ncbi:SHC-transforming protein 1-like [Aplochiton taeniatus]
MIPASSSTSELSPGWSLIMRERTLPRLKGQTGFLPGMLQRTKYSRLRNDSLSSLEERPQGVLPLKVDPSLTPEPAQCLAPLPPPLAFPTPPDQGASTLRGFIPRMTSIRLHSPASLLGLKGQTDRQRDRTTDRHADHRQTRSHWSSQPDQRLLIPAPSLSPSACHNQRQHVSDSLLAVHRCQRPITLHRVASHPWTSGCPLHSHGESLSCPKMFSSADGHILAGPEIRVVHRYIKYMGSVEVTQSMRLLDFDTRMQVTREAISQLCERTPGAAKTALKKIQRRPSKDLSSVLGRRNLQFSGSSIILTISTESVILTTASSLQTIAHHPMQSISFASGGDPDMADYVAFVAKHPADQRACHILECARGRACEVINSIGQAFEKRFRQLLEHTPPLLPTNHRSAVRLRDWDLKGTEWQREETEVNKHREHHDYYNAIPGMTPPAGGIQNLCLRQGETLEDPVTPRVCSSQPYSLYENCSLSEGTLAPPADEVKAEITVERDPSQPLSDALLQGQLKHESWYHGRLGRRQAETLLSCSGDFLVRESNSAPGQYVLSGLEGASVRHLLLVDPQGQVRTCDQVFLSVGDLVRFHMESQLPIVSGSSELCLRQPVLHRLTDTVRALSMGTKQKSA